VDVLITCKYLTVFEALEAFLVHKELFVWMYKIFNSIVIWQDNIPVGQALHTAYAWVKESLLHHLKSCSGCECWVVLIK
jgi:hypothetical protein